MISTFTQKFTSLSRSLLPRLQAPLPAPQHHSPREEPQHILITGATSGIGAEIARYLIASGHHVLTHYRNNEGHDILRKNYPEIRCTQLDLTRFEDSRERNGNSSLVNFRDWVEARVPRLDAIILNAAETGFTWQPGMDRWARSNRWIASNLAMMGLFLPLLHEYDRPNKLQGRLLYVSSSLADASIAGAEAYHKIKRETEKEIDKYFGYGRPARELLNILPFIVRPGSVDTAMHQVDIPSHGSSDLKRRTEELRNQGKLASASTTGDAIGFMALHGQVPDRDHSLLGREINRLERVNLSC